jgi:hypothetical protein
MNVLNFSFDSNSDSNSVSDEQEADQIFNNDIETKYIRNGNSDIIFNGKVKLCQITGGKHTIKIANHIENLAMKARDREVHIKAPVDNIILLGGKSVVYIHNIDKVKVNKLYIKGGDHKLEILSYVHKLEIYGGKTDIKCNYVSSKIDKIIAIGGIRNFHFNATTNKCQKIAKGGICDFHTTEPVEPPLDFIYKVGGGSISPTLYNGKKKDEICSICITNYKKDEQVYVLPCFHIFHKDCLLAWFKGKKDKFCPNCKYQVKVKINS